MDDQKKTLIVTGAVILIIIALIVSLIFFLARFITSRRIGVSPSPTTQTSETLPTTGENNASSGPAASAVPQTDLKTYVGKGFSLSYPKNWGVLTCNNSQNFELDPANPQDTKDFNCDRAVKSVTVILMNDISCEGDKIKLGGKDVVRMVEGTKGAEADYRWCVVNPNGVDMDITHRVSNSGRPSSSKQDFSAQIEQMISDISFQ